MSFRPSHIFFDLDHTLWDFEANARETLSELFVEYRHHIQDKVDFDSFYFRYKIVNQALWKLYRENKLSSTELREERFVQAFDQVGVSSGEWMVDFGEQYMEICPTRQNLMPGTEQVLETLQKKYPLHIITNGFREVQQVKLDKSGLGKYFTHIITSESAGVKKPNPGIFEFAVAKTGAIASECAFVGDDYESDVIGGNSFGMYTIFFNPESAPNPIRVPEIQSLFELLDIF